MGSLACHGWHRWSCAVDRVVVVVLLVALVADQSIAVVVVVVAGAGAVAIALVFLLPKALMLWILRQRLALGATGEPGWPEGL